MSRSPQRVVVAGAGFGGLEALFYLRWRLGRHVDLTLVAESDVFHFRPNTIYIPFGKAPERYVIPIGDALYKREIDFVGDRVTLVDPDRRTIATASGQQIEWDRLIIATGATMVPQEIPGLEENACTIWTPEQMLQLRGAFEQLVEDGRQGTRRRVLFAVPPQNKCSGPLYEIVMMLDTWLRRQGVREWVQITWTTFEQAYVQVFGPRIHEVVEQEFLGRGIEGHLRWRLESVEEGVAHYDDGREQSFDLMVSFPPYRASTAWESLPTDDRGFITTEFETRQIAGLPDIYAVGDAGDFPVKQAFLALLQADAAAEHISRQVLGSGLEDFEGFQPTSMCIMEQYDKATFAQVPLELTGDPDLPVAVRQGADDEYRVGSGEIWRLGKKMLGVAVPHRFRNGLPFHAGPTWRAMEAGLKVMSSAFAD